MKILIVTMNVKGGMVHYISQLANALSKSNKVLVIAPKGIDQKNFSKNVKVIEFPLGNIIKNFIINTIIFVRPLKLIKIINKEKPDVIHLHEPNLWLSLILPFLSRYPIIFTIHDVHPHIGSRFFFQIFSQKIISFFSTDLIFHGEIAKKEFLDTNPLTTKRCHIIPIGDFSFFLQYITNVQPERDAVLFFGRIEDYKGLEYLIESTYIVIKRYPYIKLIIAGQGDMRKYENLLRLKPSIFEIHNEFIPDYKVAEFFERAAIVILPYIEGTHTGILPIAYAFKKPVIVTNVGCIPDLVEHGKTGYIVDVKNSSALAEAIINLLENTILQQIMGENAYEKMRNELSWTSIAKKTLIVYEYAINDTKRIN